MAPSIQFLLVAGLALVIVLLLVVMLRRPLGNGAAALVQQQLSELRTRLDQLVSAQGAVPQALADSWARQAGLVADVRERLGELSETTKRLLTVGDRVAEVQQLLQVPKLRGTLGEVWLEELLRQILPPSAYRMQHTFRSGERVDAVLQLGDRLVPVDAKFPLEACQRMLAAQRDERQRERRSFERSLKDRIDEIADKYIRPDEGTYDFALMYVPAENVYYEAVIGEGDPAEEHSALAHAMRRRVIPVSPHTFYAYLLVILHGLRGLQVERHAAEIRADLGALGQHFDALWTAFQKVGTHLGNAQRQFEESDRQAARVREGLRHLVAAQPSPRTPDHRSDVTP